MTDQELSGIFGPLQFRLARTRQQIDRDVSAGRVGRELYPVLILIVALVAGGGNVGGQSVLRKVKSFQSSVFSFQYSVLPKSLNP